MRTSVTILLVGVYLVGAPAERPSGETRPLPDPALFMQEVRARLETDEDRQRDYVYVETQRQRKFDKSGATTEESIKVFESHPGLPGERRWRRLIEEDGTPVPAAELERQDRERRDHLAEHARARADGAAPVPEESAREKSRHEERLEDVFRVFTFEMIGRERRDGHDTIVVSLTPRRRAEAKTREGKIMRHFHGRAWVSESDYELVRLEAEAGDDVSIGWGLVGRIHKGSRFSFERQKVDGEAWLPARTIYTASARVLLVRRIHIGGITEYSSYRRVPPETPAE